MSSIFELHRVGGVSEEYEVKHALIRQNHVLVRLRLHRFRHPGRYPSLLTYLGFLAVSNPGTSSLYTFQPDYQQGSVYKYLNL